MNSKESTESVEFFAKKLYKNPYHLCNKQTCCYSHGDTDNNEDL